MRKRGENEGRKKAGRQGGREVGEERKRCSCVKDLFIENAIAACLRCCCQTLAAVMLPTR